MCLDKANMFWEDSNGILYYFDKTKKSNADKREREKICEDQNLILFTGTDKELEMEKIILKAHDFGMELNDKIWHQTICVQDHEDYEPKEIDGNLLQCLCSKKGFKK